MQDDIGNVKALWFQPPGQPVVQSECHDSEWPVGLVAGVGRDPRPPEVIAENLQPTGAGGVHIFVAEDGLTVIKCKLAPGAVGIADQRQGTHQGAD